METNTETNIVNKHKMLKKSQLAESRTVGYEVEHWTSGLQLVVRKNLNPQLLMTVKSEILHHG